MAHRLVRMSQAVDLCHPLSRSYKAVKDRQHAAFIPFF